MYYDAVPDILCWIICATSRITKMQAAFILHIRFPRFLFFLPEVSLQSKKEPLPYGNGSFNNSWAEVDSNHRSNLQQIYSLSPLATRESAHLSMCPDRGKLYHSLSRYASYKFKKCHLFSINARKTKGFPGVAVHSGNQSFLHIRIPYNIPSLITS